MVKKGKSVLKQMLMPDLVMINGKVVTVDKDFTIAEAVAIKNGRITFVGSNSEANELIGEGIEVLDLQGKTVLPGINDAHLHFTWWATARPPLSLDLSYPTVKSISDVVKMVKEKVETIQPGEWIFGVGWDENYLAEWQADNNRHPTRWDLDPVSPDNPVCLLDFDRGRTIWVNSKALELAKVTKETPDATGGKIIRDPATGEPTGILNEFIATALVMRVIPPWTAEQIREGMLAAMKELASLGITSITDPGIGPGTSKVARGAVRYESLSIYNDLYNEDRLTVRVSILLTFGFWLTPGNLSLKRMKEYLAYVGTHTGFGNEFLKIAGVKLGSDDIPTDKTAWMYEDYVGGGNGHLLTAGQTEEERYEELVSMIDYASKQRFQIGIHSTGDRAIDACVDGFIKAMKEDPWDARHYIIHGNFTTPQCAKRMAKYNIGNVVQSHFKWTTSDFMDTVVGEKKSAYEWPLRTLIDAGVHVANSSDAPITYPNWKVGIEAAVTRESKASGKISGPEQRLSRKEAIRTFTIEGAWIDHMENVKGSIEVGKLADFCVLDQDILTVDIHQIHSIATLMTIVGGKIVYNAKPDLFQITKAPRGLFAEKKQGKRLFGANSGCDKGGIAKRKLN